MKFKKTLLGFLPYVLLIVIAAQAVAVGLLNHIKLCIAELAILVVATVVCVIYDVTKHKRYAKYIQNIVDQMSPASNSLLRLDLPVLAVKDGVIFWYNQAFRKQIMHGQDCVGLSSDFIVMPDLIEHAYGDGANLEYEGKYYRFFACKADNDITICYFVDRTDAVAYRDKYEKGKPVAAYITVDNIDELMRGTRDSEGAQISSAIEKRIENWASEVGAVCRKITNDRFLLVTDETGFDYMTDTRFDILNKVKAIDFGDKGKATLSIGVGRGADGFSACEEFARQALDMALGRGGDQAAVRDNKDFEFFGGTSTTVTKRSKVRTRMVATALSELISNSDNVLIMGHRFADLDSFGSCYGMYCAVKTLGKPANIVVQQDKCMCNQLVDYVVNNSQYENIVVSPQKANDLMTKDTLLIITDTHRPSFVESPELYQKATTVVVVDHHRKTVDHIDNAVIFYHEPYASSACEMVSELLQYMSVKIGKTESEALLSGVMLDTRNFVLNTGVRTFEASAFLRSCGASTVTVKGFFQNNIDVYKLRAEIVSKSTVYGNCAISYTDNQGENVRLASAQAADELLGIQSVDASFVLFKTGNTVNISARSFGVVNVQLIMESLGGGGHLTMAACQLENAEIDDAISNLKNAIETYHKKNI